MVLLHQVSILILIEMDFADLEVFPSMVSPPQ